MGVACDGKGVITLKQLEIKQVDNKDIIIEIEGKHKYVYDLLLFILNSNLYFHMLSNHKYKKINLI